VKTVEIIANEAKMAAMRIAILGTFSKPGRERNETAALRRTAA
jgi:hypothetical protein